MVFSYILVQKNQIMLKIGGYINILIAVGHLIGLFWTEKMFEVTGIGKEMQKLAQINALLP